MGLWFEASARAGPLLSAGFQGTSVSASPGTGTQDSRSPVLFPGCTLLFYESDGRSGIDPASTPKHAVWVEDSIVQAVPEHPKKDFVFCLSNSLGDAFLFQVRRGPSGTRTGSFLSRPHGRLDFLVGAFSCGSYRSAGDETQPLVEPQGPRGPGAEASASGAALWRRGRGLGLDRA